MVWKRKEGPSSISAPALVTSFIVEAGIRGVSGRKLATGTRPPESSIRQTRAEVPGFARAKAEMAPWTSPAA